MTEHFLVTGAMGCIGAWVVRNLIRENTPVTVFDVATDPRRLTLLLSPEDLARVSFIAGDITDLIALENALDESAITHVIHLAALQVPFCKADPPLGARVNVVGTVNVFEAVKKRRHIRKVVYASSAAVYDVADAYPQGTPVPDDAHLRPNTLYGVYKQANEGTARVYWQDDGLSSIGLRPYVVYGVGRDQGMTSTPTKAMFAAAVGQPYHISFGGRCDFEYAEDVAHTFIAAARAPFEGMGIFNLVGTVAHMREIVSAIEAAAPEMRGRITFEDKPLPFPEEMDGTSLTTRLGAVSRTPLAMGVKQTVDYFRELAAAGRLARTAMLD
ncbi:MAG: NAD-dependent epimerase/dehydratase family protein [Anaerolineales bacterium]